MKNRGFWRSSSFKESLSIHSHVKPTWLNFWHLTKKELFWTMFMLLFSTQWKHIVTVELQNSQIKNPESSPFGTLLQDFWIHNDVYFQGLVEVITSSDDGISVRATILLGELLHMVLYWNEWMQLQIQLNLVLYLKMTLSDLRFIFRQTPFSLTPIITTCTACPHLWTWLLLLTFLRRKDCELDVLSYLPDSTNSTVSKLHDKYFCDWVVFGCLLDGPVLRSITWSDFMRRRNEAQNPIVFTWTTLFANRWLLITVGTSTSGPRGTFLSLRYVLVTGRKHFLDISAWLWSAYLLCSLGHWGGPDDEPERQSDSQS